MQAPSDTIQKLWPILKFFADKQNKRQTDRAKTIYVGHEKIAMTKHRLIKLLISPGILRNKVRNKETNE